MAESVVPSEVSEVAARNGWGACRGRVRSLWSKAAISLLSPFLMVAFIWVVMHLLFEGDADLVVCLLAAPLLLWRLVPVVAGLGGVGMCLYLYDGGLILRRGEGAIREFPWARTTLMAGAVNRRTSRSSPGSMVRRVLVLDSPVGGRVTLTHHAFSAMDEITTTIETLQVRARLTGCVDTVRAGETLRFGEFTVDSSGVGYPGGGARWPDIDHAGLSEGWVIVVGTTGRALSSALRARTPNSLLFLKLVEEMLSAARREGGLTDPDSSSRAR